MFKNIIFIQLWWNIQKAYFLKVSNVFYVYKQNLWLDNLKTRTSMNAKASVFVICVEAIIYLLLYNVHDFTFNTQIKSPFSFKETAKSYKLLGFSGQ